MGAVNVLLFMLVLIIFTVYEATGSDPYNVKCENVTGSVGEVLTLSCDVSWHRSKCCIRSYKFKYTEDDSDSVIYREEFPSHCEQRPKLTCSYSSNKILTAKVMIFLQTTCGQTFTYFTVKITESMYPNVVHDKDEQVSIKETPNEKSYKSKIAVIIAAVSSFVIITIIIMEVIHKKMKHNHTNRSELQMDYIKCITAKSQQY